MLTTMMHQLGIIFSVVASISGWLRSNDEHHGIGLLLFVLGAVPLVFDRPPCLAVAAKQSRKTNKKGNKTSRISLNIY